MKLLLPHSFKLAGAIMAPFGFALWLIMQLGYLKRLIKWVTGEVVSISNNSTVHSANVIVAIVGFFSFLAGVYFLVFSKEKTEDEMIQKTRMDSFQFAAFFQFAFIVIGFLWMILKEPGEKNLMLFFVAALFIFWLSFILRFSYTLYIKLR